MIKTKFFKKSKFLFAAIAILLSFAISAGAVDALIPLGRTTGINLSSDGAMVVSYSENINPNPAKTAGIAPGDIILRVGERKIFSNRELVEEVSKSDGNPLVFEYSRNGKTHTATVTPAKTDDGYAVGIWVRDGIAGIGTLTYLNPEDNSYGALGHGISDTETNTTIPIRQGSLMPSSVSGVKKGRAGEPGELHGTFDLNSSFATIDKNSVCGIFGKVTDTSYFQKTDAIPLAKRGEIKRGPAKILSNIDGEEVCEYDIEICGIYFDGEKTKNMLIRATDPRLLEKTGGIVCGMSGSPIIQNGKLVGAVTHVLVNDPTNGYGIFIENMLAEAA